MEIINFCSNCSPLPRIVGYKKANKTIKCCPKMAKRLLETIDTLIFFFIFECQTYFLRFLWLCDENATSNFFFHSFIVNANRLMRCRLHLECSMSTNEIFAYPGIQYYFQNIFLLIFSNNLDSGERPSQANPITVLRSTLESFSYQCNAPFVGFASSLSESFMVESHFFCLLPLRRVMLPVSYKRFVHI